MFNTSYNLLELRTLLDFMFIEGHVMESTDVT